MLEIALIIEDISMLRAPFARCGLLWTRQDANGAMHVVAHHLLTRNLSPFRLAFFKRKAHFFFSKKSTLISF